MLTFTKKSWRILILFTVFVGILILLISFIKFAKPKYSNNSFIQLGDAKMEVEIADDDKERERGLSGRSALADGRGMLFVFDQPSQKTFWARDMRFSFDIIWINEDSKVVGVEKNIQPSSFPKKYLSPESVKYVLEANSNFVEKNNIKTNDQLTIDVR